MQPPASIPKALEIAKPLIQEFEECRLREYLDIRGLPTIGWGQRIRHNQFPGGITQAQADKMFETTLEGFYNGVLELVRPSYDRWQFQFHLAAFTSFAYNVGFGSWHPFEDGFMTSTLLRVYNQGYASWPLAADEFLRWDHADGVEVPGLKRRRMCEQKIFNGATIADLEKLGWFENEQGNPPSPNWFGY